MLRLLIVVSSVCWVARCDLLDLYVQHMDETMKTLAYRSRHHEGTIKDARTKRGAVLREEPILRIGTFKKQRLDVDKEWYAQWKAKRKLFPYKQDGLDFPNSREENLDPSQHELLKHDPNRSRIRESEETTTTKSRQNASNHETMDDDIEVSREESTIPRRFNDTADEQPIENESREETIDFPRDISRSDSEVIDEAAGRNIPLDDDPILKRIPKSRDRVPKKYAPPMDKSAKLFRGYAKRLAGWGEFGGNNRGRRSAREAARFTRRESLDDDGEVVLEWDPSDEEMVTFKVTAKTLGYVGIGFNERNHMKGADILLAWVDDHTGTVNLLVSYASFHRNGRISKGIRPYDR